MWRDVIGRIYYYSVDRPCAGRIAINECGWMSVIYFHWCCSFVFSSPEREREGFFHVCHVSLNWWIRIFGAVEWLGSWIWIYGYNYIQYDTLVLYVPSLSVTVRLFSSTISRWWCHCIALNWIQKKRGEGKSSNNLDCDGHTRHTAHFCTRKGMERTVPYIVWLMFSPKRTVWNSIRRRQSILSLSFLQYFLFLDSIWNNQSQSQSHTHTTSSFCSSSLIATRRDVFFCGGGLSAFAFYLLLLCPHHSQLETNLIAFVSVHHHCLQQW